MSNEEPQELSTGMELGKGPDLRISSSGGKTIINFPDDPDALEQTIEATADILEIMRKKLTRLKATEKH